MSQGLQKVPLFIPLGQGLRTDVDDRLLPVGKVSTIENLQWMKQGEATKRPGSVTMGDNYVTSGTPSAMPVPWQLATHKGALVELSQAGPRPVGQYSPGIDKWMVPPVVLADGSNGLTSKLRGQLLAQRAPVFRSSSANGITSSSSYVDVATDGTYALIVWTFVDVSSVSRVFARVFELATQKQLFEYTVATGSTAKSRYANGFFTLTFQPSVGVIQEAHISSSAIGTGNGALSGLTTLVTDTITSYDVQVQGNNIALLYANNAHVKQVIYPGGSPGSAVTTEIKDSSNSSIVVSTVCWVQDFPGSGIIAIAGAGAGGLALYLNVSGGRASGSYNVDATSYPVGLWNIAAHFTTTSSAGEFSIVYQPTGGAAILLGCRTNAHGASSATWIAGGAYLISQTFAHNGDYYCLVNNKSVIQGTDFALRVPVNLDDPTEMTRTPSAKLAANVSPDGDRQNVLVTSVGGGAYVAAIPVRTSEYNIGAATVFETGVDLVSLTFDPIAVGGAREYADSLYVAGGILGQFDGQTFAEEGFHLSPEAPVLSQTTGGSLTLLGDYFYASVYRYKDGNGRIYRSQPSVPAEIPLAGSNNSVHAVVNTLKFNGRPGQIAIELYRVAKAGTPGTDTSIDMVLVAVTANDETVDTVTIVDTMSDANAGFALPLYTNGSVLPMEPAPPALAVAAFQGGLAVISADDPKLVMLTLPLTDLDGPGAPWFSSSSSVRIDDFHGDLVGCAAMDDKLLLFKADAVYVVTGPGPNVQGVGLWSIPAFVCTGVGTTQARSIVETPEGVMFKCNSGRAGYYLINRGLSLQYLGSPVQAYIGDTVVDAVHVPQFSRTHIFTAQGRTEVYDHALSQLTGEPMWSTYTNQPAACATVWNGRPVYQQGGNSALNLLREDATGTFWDENGTPNDEYLLTPWLSLAGALKAYQRFYKLQGAGKMVGEHIVTVTMYVDFDDTTVVATRSVVVGPTGPSQDWNAWELKAPSKASSVRFGIRCSKLPADRNDTAGANISGITVIYGAKQGLRKTSWTNRLT